MPPLNGVPKYFFIFPGVTLLRTRYVCPVPRQAAKDFWQLAGKLSRGLSPPLTPPYVPFMAYGGFQSAFKELIKRDISLRSQPCVIHNDVRGLRASYPPPPSPHCNYSTP